MHKWLMSVLFFGACVFGLVALIIVSQPEPSEDEQTDASGTPVLKIEATNFQFDQPEYHVKAGSTMKVTLKNVEGVHGVEIQGLGVTLDSNNPSKEVTFDKPGTYPIRCAVLCGPGHNDMVSKLIVE
jgi:cytochrome c oxidase subunit 2